ncbi:phage tail protein [Bradyrhizobium sp. CCBAU 11361]|uniref:phage tail protein n=1 Tax=Bradyrhizobium sp. CCBAU 11361 TaxID=1630812 RepID=UPI002304359B|nr:tail fiber protein [Bradyrhizobium sp. CCBAU 11361]
MSSTPYDRQTSFALFSAENPSKQQSGTDLDAEFNAVKLAVDDTQQNLALIQDDDGALKRGSVGQAQFDSSVSLGFAAPAQWASGVLYTANVNTVFYNSIFYIANTTHTSGVSFEPAKWDEIADFTAAAAIPDGSITSVKLADGAVAANKLADGVVSNTKIATGAVTTNKLADNNVTFVKLATDIGPALADLLIPAGLGPLPWSLPDLPTGWDWADGGVLLSNTVYPALRTALIAAGFPHGQDGSGNPKKPDTRGSVVAGTDTMGATGAAGRLSSATISGGALLGKRGGEERHTLITSEIPSHSHANSLSDPGHTHSINPAAAPSGSTYASGPSTGIVNAGSVNATQSATTGITINNASAGGGGAHNNVQPTLVCGMIIKAH